MSEKISAFFQEGPVLKNTYESDELLRLFLKWKLPPDVFAEIEPGLVKIGERAVTDIYAWGEEAEAQPPRHVAYDAWGRRIDQVEVSEAWQKLHRVAAEEGLVAIGYERKNGEYSRLHQFTKLYLIHPSTAFYTCPLAMTDGAARVLELYGDTDLREEAFRNLTSRNPLRFWTSGQWMTERAGGSDVSGTSTIAKIVDGEYRLYGDKWFTSAVTAQMALALAKVEGAADKKGGLSLFYVELRDKAGQLQNIRVNRLKDKLGTKALPTAELTLEGTPARMIGQIGEGVKRVASLLNISRSYNSICALSTMARGLALAKDYAKRRYAFGRTLAEHPLHLKTLADLQAEFEGCFHLTFHLAFLLGKDETDHATNEEKQILRLLTPLTKLWTGKKAVEIVSEAIEAIGGAAYVEDTGLPRLLRDAQVFPIWEGTTNVLSLDSLRAMSRDGAIEPFLQDVESRLKRLSSESLQSIAKELRQAVVALRAQARLLQTSGDEALQSGAREFAFGLARVFAASLLAEFSDWCQERKQRAASEEVLRQFCARPLVAFSKPEELGVSRLEKIVYG